MTAGTCEGEALVRMEVRISSCSSLVSRLPSARRTKSTMRTSP